MQQSPPTSLRAASGQKISRLGLATAPVSAEQQLPSQPSSYASDVSIQSHEVKGVPAPSLARTLPWLPSSDSAYDSLSSMRTPTTQNGNRLWPDHTPRLLHWTEPDALALHVNLQSKDIGSAGRAMHCVHGAPEIPNVPVVAKHAAPASGQKSSLASTQRPHRVGERLEELAKDPIDVNYVASAEDSSMLNFERAYGGSTHLPMEKIGNHDSFRRFESKSDDVDAEMGADSRSTTRDATASCDASIVQRCFDVMRDASYKPGSYRKTDDSGSSISSVTTSDASQARKSCHVCKKIFLPRLTHYLQCTTCPRRYHRWCLPNSRSLRVESTTNWQCKRCIKKASTPSEHIRTKLAMLDEAIGKDATPSHDHKRQRVGEWGPVALGAIKQPDPFHSSAPSATFIDSLDNAEGQEERPQVITRDPNALPRPETMPTPKAVESPIGVVIGASKSMAASEDRSVDTRATASSTLDCDEVKLGAWTKTATRTVRKPSKTELVPCHLCKERLVPRTPSGVQVFCVKCKDCKERPSERGTSARMMHDGQAGSDDIIMADAPTAQTLSATNPPATWDHGPSPKPALTVRTKRMQEADALHTSIGDEVDLCSSLVEEWSEYSLSNRFDRRAKMTEIENRARRKDLFGMPALYSSTGEVPVLEQQQRLAKRIAAEPGPESNSSPCTQAPGTSTIIHNDGTMTIRCDDVDDLLYAKDELIPTVYEGKLYYRDQRKNANGTLSRATFLCPTGI